MNSGPAVNDTPPVTGSGAPARAADAVPLSAPLRTLRVPTPEVHTVVTADGVELRLTRYEGGGKGPLLLAHGLGVSSLMFATDTIETNLLEYLCAHGYDVWLMDMRVSIALPASAERSSGDDIALHDWPACVDAVLRLTGQSDLHVVAHCYGSTTFLMAMLAGLQGVRSAVCSQGTLHLRPDRTSRFKAGIFLPTVLNALGVTSLSSAEQPDGSALTRLLNLAARLQPIELEEWCTSASCRRITFLYSPLYEHDQLSAATHDRLDDLFGVANIDAFEHLTRMVRRGQVVSARGKDSYMPHLSRLALPITFLHGAENRCFRPVGSQETMQLLAYVNGPQLYQRWVIPDYGHIDCMFGQHAARDVYPFIARHLDAHAA